MIVEPSAPTEARDVAERQAMRFIEGGKRRARPVAAGMPEESRLFPVYAVDPSRPLRIGDIVGLPPTGWRMVLLSGQGDVVASSEVRNRDHGFTPSGFAAGSRSLNRLYHRLIEARDEPGLEGRYEARFFEAPSLHVRALWLHGPQDVFIMPDSTPHAFASESEMLGIVNQVFERKASSRDPHLYDPPPRSLSA